MTPYEIITTIIGTIGLVFVVLKFALDFFKYISKKDEGNSNKRK